MPDRNIPNRNLKPSRLRRWRMGDPLSAAHLNETVEAVQRLEGGVNPAEQVRARTTKDPAQVRQFRILSVEGDYIRCERQVGTYENDGVDDVWNIAKPYLLRRTPFDGTDGRNSITYAYNSDTERVATDANSDTETQVVVPSYQVGDIVYAIESVKGGTGVQFTRGSETITVDLLDLNVDGRAWAKQ